ncbi:MAG: excinuclease ABC subunit A [Fidelibacterota bacterium]
MNKKKRLVLKKHRRNIARLKRIKLESLARQSKLKKSKEPATSKVTTEKPKKVKTTTKSAAKKTVKKTTAKSASKAKAA